MDWAWLTKTFDHYERLARIAPALIVVLPLILVVNALSPEIFVGNGVFSAGIVAYLGIALMVTVVRDAGRKVELTLYKEWGGAPTTQLLRHSNKNLESQTKRRFHSFLQSKIPGLVLPNAEEEKRHPEKADEAYASAVTWLRENTRDTKKHSLVFVENCGYGFRRNLFGIKRIGLGLSFLSLVVSVGAGMNISGLDISDFPTAVLISIIVSIILFGFWLLLARASWVREAAFAYAYRLLAACDSLAAGR